MSRFPDVLVTYLALTFSVSAASDEIRFVDATQSAGLVFEHMNGMVGERWLLEVNGAGVGLLDFDGDGLLDMWLVQGGPIADRSGKLPGDRLYRNISSNGTLRFTDVTDASGVIATGYGMGIATGDIDGDGDLDVFIANYGANQMFENHGTGQFKDITGVSGVAGKDWSAGASFVDFDKDGLLDLYVVNYVDFTLATHKSCLDLAGRPTYCAPNAFPSQADRLYRNMGDGRFSDVTATSGISRLRRSGLGVIAADFNSDGLADFYVANDAMDNALWLNQGDGNFTDQALLSGVAVNGNGEAEASMGIAAEDYDNDCDVDLFLTHLAAETNTLYVNEGTNEGSDGLAWFIDASNQAGIAASSSPYTGFGAAWFDADNDGDLDLMSANGAVTPLAHQVVAGIEHPLRQRNQLWANNGNGVFHEANGGPAFELEEVSRGAAFGDLDNDGDTDIVLSNNNGRARIYENRSSTNHWLGLESHGGDSNGEVRIDSSACGYRRWATDGSYASASDARVVIGLGSVNADQHVRVKWSDGMEEVFGPLMSDRYHRIKRGGGRSQGSMP